MLDTLDVVGPRVFRELVAAGSVRSAVVQGADRGLVVVLQVGLNERTLGTVRGGARYFQSLDGAASVLQQAGIVEFGVNTSNWTPRTKRRGADEDA